MHSRLYCSQKATNKQCLSWCHLFLATDNQKIIEDPECFKNKKTKDPVAAS